MPRRGDASADAPRRRRARSAKIHREGRRAMNGETRERLERELDEFDPDRRREALADLWRDRRARRGWRFPSRAARSTSTPTPSSPTTPTAIRRRSSRGWRAGADWRPPASSISTSSTALEEFLDAGRLIGLKTLREPGIAGVRAGIRQLVINSPGEPGIAYHMGVGFPRDAVASLPRGNARRGGDADARDGPPRQCVSRSGRARLRPRCRATDAERQRDRASPLRGV